MSDGDPSLEEEIPKPLLEQPIEAHVFTPKVSAPIYTGSIKLNHIPQGTEAEAERQELLSDHERLELAKQQMFSFSRDDFLEEERGDDGQRRESTEMDEQRQEADIQAMSALSVYPDDLSREMNTDRDNGSEASTRAAETIGDGATTGQSCAGAGPGPSAGLPNGNGKTPSHCAVIMMGMGHNKSLYFNDGVRCVDFVLVWEGQRAEAATPEAAHRRAVFERHLEAEGLQLEREAPPGLGSLHFVKIHTPLHVLRDYSEILKLRMPMKECSMIAKNSKMNSILNAAMYMSKFSALRDVRAKTNSWADRIAECWRKLMSHIKVDTTIFPERKNRLTAIYSKEKEYLFDVHAPCFWTPSARSRIVQFILDRKRFSDGEHDDFAFGIARLVAMQTYSAAYPLHDGDLKTPGSMRYLLYQEWASVIKCLRYQPLDYVKDYFGVKIGLYFAWLGFYTHMLIPASIVGLICFIYSASTMYSNTPSEDVCKDNSTVLMCPLCDYWCQYWDIKESCLHARVSYLIDNPTTVFFAIFMSFWAALFLELWKRYSAEMTHRWDLTGFDVYEEHPRPQYLARLAHVKRTQLNVVTGEREPMVPFWRMRLPATLMSFSVVCLLVLLAMATVLGVALYRMSVSAALSVSGADHLKSHAILITTATAASINLVFICVFNYIYQYLAEWLTEKELLRTQTEFDDSLTLKIYLLQFVNYYASIFYIAFFKGKFVGRPGNYHRFFGYRQEECGPGGCLMELCIQLAIIMIGKQAVNTVVEMMLPHALQWWNLLRTIGRRNRIKSSLQWVKDFKLVDFGHMGLFPEYLEMVLQYGFVTIFVSAFPLAPLFALLNNVLEMRLDARKLLTSYRRPVPQRVNDIGVWYRILDSIGKLSIITNGFIIAFTSELIPRLVYQLSVSPDGSLHGYLDHTLAQFNVSVIPQPFHSTYNGSMCRYPGYWVGTEAENYQRTDLYWHVMGARLAFVVVFENVVALVMIIVRWAIPDMSGELRDRIRREAYVINTFIMEETRARSARGRPASAAPAATGDTPSDRPGAPAAHTPGGESATLAESNWHQLLSASLSESDFVLAAYGQGGGDDLRSSGDRPVQL